MVGDPSLAIAWLGSVVVGNLWRKFCACCYAGGVDHDPLRFYVLVNGALVFIDNINDIPMETLAQALPVKILEEPLPAVDSPYESADTEEDV